MCVTAILSSLVAKAHHVATVASKVTLILMDRYTFPMWDRRQQGSFVEEPLVDQK